MNPNLPDPNRRHFLYNTAWGFGSLALTSLLADDLRAGKGSVPQQEEVLQQGAVRVLHHPPKAKRVVQLFMAGLPATLTCGTISRSWKNSTVSHPILARKSRPFRTDWGPG